ncbi:MAG TPA: gamma-glutamyltransferase [Gemmatimonadetes bacterium]|jgi:gamma-glutamyltranspeptidase/glutathione hydrolase|nr:gamma-glutamyltransferase [Gemmatimonadota bacterium]
MQFPSMNRPDVRGVNGAVVSDHPLATAAGYTVLKNGGNAVDAAITMAGILAVVRPHMNGVGGDAFGIFYDGETGEVIGMNGSGRAGSLATPEFFEVAGQDEIPSSGPLSVSVPGAVAAWDDALSRFGTISLSEALAPAIQYAREGFPVSTRLASDIAGASEHLNEPAKALYLPASQPADVGSLLKNAALAETLETIAKDGKDGFYRGAVANQIADFLEGQGGYLRNADFRDHQTTWVTPLEGNYLDRRVLVLPPNTQGIAQLQLMEMAKSYDLEEMGHNSQAYLHTLIELKKLAFADRDRWVADPSFEKLPLSELLAPDYLRFRSTLIESVAAENVLSGMGTESDASDSPGDTDDGGDTVYLTVVDQWGNAVSWIQSLFGSFGSGLLEPETGVVLQNRGALFTLDRSHPNVVAPGKRPYHTLTPTMGLNPDGSFSFALGTPGGDSQVQSLVQILNNLFMFGMTPQEAIEAPRFRSYQDLRVAFEDRFPADILQGLADQGHLPNVVNGWTATFGGAQMILLEGSGTLTAAADPRREAYALAY